MDTQTHTITKIKIHIETQADTQNSSRSSQYHKKLPPKCVCSFSAKSETKDQLCVKYYFSASFFFVKKGVYQFKEMK